VVVEPPVVIVVVVDLVTVAAAVMGFAERPPFLSLSSRHLLKSLKEEVESQQVFRPEIKEKQLLLQTAFLHALSEGLLPEQEEMMPFWQAFLSS
jgi:hypothetical protein